MTDLEPSLAVIPARGGSKGLPGKNVRPLAGLPLLVHSVRCAALCPRLSRTVISTDSEEIAGVGRAYGGDVPFLRPPELARDDSPMLPALVHALETMEKLEGRRYGTVVLLDPTSPGRLPDDIDRAFTLLDADPEADGVIACSEPRFNPFWVGVVRNGAYLEPAFPKGLQYARRQDVPTFLRINGALYVWRRAFVLRAHSVLEGRQIPLEIPERRAFAVDTAEEFELLQALVDGGLLRLPWLEAR